jgi:hypothetical protein
MTHENIAAINIAGEIVNARNMSEWRRKEKDRICRRRQRRKAPSLDWLREGDLGKLLLVENVSREQHKRRSCLSGVVTSRTATFACCMKRRSPAENYNVSESSRPAVAAAAEPVLRRCPGPKAEQLPPRENKRYIAVIKTLRTRLLSLGQITMHRLLRIPLA